MAEDYREDGVERDTRFTSLLHPNRDLAVNWTVDVEKQLEAYLNELASTGMFDDGQCALNFAEAALLIQGSIQVYSRKVEYLYALVLQALNFLGQKKQGEEGNSASQDDDNITENREEKEEEFLNLDDVHEETNIDILDEEGVGSVNCTVKIPACLLATEAEPADLFGKAGELASYEIATSIMHRTFLLLDPCDAETVDRYLDCDAYGAEKGVIPPTPGSAMQMKTPRNQRAAPHERTGSAQKRANPETPSVNVSEGGCAFDSEADWQGDQGGMNWDDQNIGERHGGESHGDGDFSNKETGAGHEANLDAEKDDYVDPWAPLNPHEPGTLLIKPYKKGLTQRKKPRLKKRRNIPAPIAIRTGVCFPEFLKALQVRERLEKAERRRHVPDDSPTFETLRGSFRIPDAGLPADEADEHAEGFGGEPGDFEVEDNDDWPGHTFEAQENIHDDLLDNNHLHGPVDPPQQPASRGKENRSPYMDMPSFDDERGVEEVTFEELCRAHLDSMLRKLSEAHTRTGLTSRVTKWKNKIEATLVDEDTRPPFDIHEYGDRLLDELATLATRSQDGDEEIQESFTYLVRGQQRDQVARSFSALLQLVNNGNVIIDKGEVGSESVCFTGDKPFSVKLLNSQNKHDGMFENMIPAKTSKKTPGRSKAPRPQQMADRSRGKQQQRLRVVQQRSNLVSSPQSPGSPNGSRCSLALTTSPGSVRRSSRKRRQTVYFKRGGSPDKENRGASTPLDITPVKLTPDGRHRSRRKALAKLVQ